MEEGSGKLKHRKSNFGKNRPSTSAPITSNKTNIVRKNNIGLVESMAALTLGDGIHAAGSKVTPNIQAPATQAKNLPQPKKIFMKVPNQCMKKFNVEDFNTNNYKAIEAVINEILTGRKNRSSAKKSKAKTDVRPKKHDGTEIALEADGIHNQEEDNKKGRNVKPKSAQARSHRHYYKQGVPEYKNRPHTDFVPKGLSELIRINEESEKGLKDLNGMKLVLGTKAAADKFVNVQKE